MRNPGPDKSTYDTAKLEPSAPLVAGSYVSLKLVYTAGSSGLASGSCLRIYTDSDTDWGVLQASNPSDPNYLTVTAPKGVRISVHIESVKTISLRVMSGEVRAGKKVIVNFGDRSGGSPGTRVQTFAEEKRYFWISILSPASTKFMPLPDPPSLKITGGVPAQLRVTAPSVVTRDEPFRLLIKAIDEWGNLSPATQSEILLQGKGIMLPENRFSFQKEENALGVLEGCRCSQSGIYRVVARDVLTGLRTESNPIQCREKGDKHNLYWADLHGGQVELAEKIPDFFRYARDVSALDIVGFQRNDHDMSNEDYAFQQKTEEELYQPGSFVPLPGFEWSGDTEVGGDHNIYFPDSSQPLRRSSHSGVEDKSDSGQDLKHISQVYAHYRGTNTVIIPHVGGRNADLDYHDPDLEPNIEITSTHGTFEWLLEDSIGRNYKMGFVGGSDGYTGRPGGEYPGHFERRYAKGGLTGIYANRLTAESVMEALKARHCYATTGSRIIANVAMCGYTMGDRCKIRSPLKFDVFVAGTAPLESVQLFRGLQPVYSYPMPSSYSRNQVRILWEGSSRKSSYSGVIWDGEVEIHGTKLLGYEKVRFDSPRSTVSRISRDKLLWHSVVCGYRSGIILELEKTHGAAIVCNVATTLISASRYGAGSYLGSMGISYRPAEKVSFAIDLNELISGPRVIEIGKVNRRLTLSFSPDESRPKEVQFTYTDEHPEPKENPYWLRVIQTDMEMAWTSPIFVQAMHGQ